MQTRSTSKELLRVAFLFFYVPVFAFGVTVAFITFPLLRYFWKAIRLLRRFSLLVILLLVLFLPALLFLAKQELAVEEESALFRREFITLVSIDVSLTQHFFVVFGYVMTAVILIALGGSLFGASFDFLFSLFTIGANDSTGKSKLFSALLAAYGTFGVALVVSIIVTTYSTIMEEFPRSEGEIEEYMENNLASKTSNFSVDFGQMDEEKQAIYVKMMAGDTIREMIEKGYLGDPTLTRVWVWLRSRDRKLPMIVPEYFRYFL